MHTAPSAAKSVVISIIRTRTSCNKKNNFTNIDRKLVKKMERKKYFSNILGSQFDKFCTSKRGVGERRLRISSWGSFFFRNYSLHCNSLSRHSCFCRQNCCHYLKQNRQARSTLAQPSYLAASDDAEGRTAAAPGQ
jgi:hypothetical protein